MMLRQVILLSICIWLIEAATVLDPSLYLSPRPPLTDTSDSISPGDRWTHSVESLDVAQERSIEPKRKPEPKEKAKLFWPSLRPTYTSVGTGNIQIPMTFSLTGIYGKYTPQSPGTGVIGSSYGTVSEIGGTAVSALAGSGYGKYRSNVGVRIYGGQSGSSWSGWGNGKWGHYGKG